MGPDRTVMLMLPVVFLLSAASWAATLGGLGGECNRQGVEKNKRTHHWEPFILCLRSTFRKK